MTQVWSQSPAGWISWCLCLAALAATGTTFAEESASTASDSEQQDLLQNMNEAVRQRNYRGVMVYARNGEMRGLNVVHRYENGREQERIQSLGSEPREIIRDEDVVTCILPKDRQVMLDRTELRGMLASVRELTTEDIAPHYEMVLEKHSRLINRDCRIYHIRPRDTYRYGYRLWVDDETSLPLRMDLLGESGQVLEQTMYTQIEFPESIPDEALQPRLDPANYQWIRLDEANSVPVREESHWRVGELPPGFKLVDREMRMPADARTPIEHLLYSDGLATVSVMLRPQRDERVRFRGLSRMGAVNVYAQQVDGYHITVMGEVPSATVEYFGRRVHALNAADPDTVAAPAVTPAASRVEETGAR